MNELEIINSAINEYKPFKVFALFSGGNDSVCSAHIASQAKQFDGVVYIDTGISVEGALDYAHSIAENFGWKFQVAQTPESYDDIVREYGFPGPSAHKYMYIMLKDRAIEKLFRETKTSRFQRIILVTGARRFESDRRMINVTAPVVKMKSRVWVAPLWEWSSEIKDEYIKMYHLPRNPVKEILHVSGDCLCGAYNDKGDLAVLKAFYPNTAERILKLQEEIKDKHPWAWDEVPPQWLKLWKQGQRFLGDEFMPLCWNCDNMAASNKAWSRLVEGSENLPAVVNQSEGEKPA